MIGYTDVFVIPVPKSRADEYRKLATLSATIWREHGALSYVELEGDDVSPGQWTSFPRSVELNEDEFVIVAVIGYRSREHRDEVNAKAMKDPRFAGIEPKSMPFDTRRMYWGGFKPYIGAAPAPTAQPYLFFRGRCEEAIEYYKRALCAEVEVMMRFKDNPDHPGPDAVPAAFDDRIMHAELRIAGSTVMMSDGMASGALDFQCMSLALSVQAEAEVDRLCNALAAEGTVQMPVGPTFFAKRFGAVSDRFGVSWMVMVPLPA